MSRREELHWDMQEDNSVSLPVMDKLANHISKRLDELTEIEGHIFCKCPCSAEANVIDEDFQIDLRRCTCPGFTSQMKQIIGDSTGQEAADKIDEWIKNNPDYIVTGFIKQLKIEKEYFKKEANP